MRGASESLHRRTWPVSGQGEYRRRTIEPGFPERQLFLQYFALQPVSLPECVVCILDGEFRKRCGFVVECRRIQRRQIVDQHPR